MPAPSLSLSFSLPLCLWRAIVDSCERSRSPTTRRLLRGSSLPRPRLRRRPHPSPGSRRCLPGRKLASHLALMRRAARASHQRGNLFNLSDTIRYVDSFGRQPGEQSSSGSSAARSAPAPPHPPRGQVAVLCFTLPLPPPASGRCPTGGSNFCPALAPSLPPSPRPPPPVIAIGPALSPSGPRSLVSRARLHFIDLATELTFRERKAVTKGRSCECTAFLCPAGTIRESARPSPPSLSLSLSLCATVY